MARSRLALGVAALSLVLIAVGVIIATGRSSDNPPAPQPDVTAATRTPEPDIPLAITQATARTTARKTAKINTVTNLKLTAPGRNDRVNVTTSTGVVNFTTRSEATTSTGTNGTRLEQRIVASQLYQRTIATSGSGGPSAWIQASRNAQGNDQSAATEDPAPRLGFLTGAAAPVTTVGTEGIGGVKTTHYTFEIDLNLASKRGSLSAATVAYYQKLLGSDTLPVDAWIDGDGLLRQFTFTQNVKEETAGGTVSGVGVRTVTYSDFGTPASITAPPANEIAPAG
jgi:hypothetical protein